MNKNQVNDAYMTTEERSSLTLQRVRS